MTTVVFPTAHESALELEGRATPNPHLGFGLALPAPPFDASAELIKAWQRDTEVLQLVAQDPNGEQDDAPVDLTEEDVVLFHCRLLEQLALLADPHGSIADQLDILLWIFTDPSKTQLPFSFESCVKVACTSPMSSLPYVGRVDEESLENSLRNLARRFLKERLAQFPEWVRSEFRKNPTALIDLLDRDPQVINMNVQRHALAAQCGQGDLFT